MTARKIVVVAGAGTGKTHALVEQYLGALLGLDDAKPTSPDRVLAITFTEKAANEMRARVQRRLGDVLFHPEREPVLVEKLRAASIEKRALESIRRAVTGAPIVTFHAFCARVLRDHALAANLDPSFLILEPDDEQRLLEETAEACVVDALGRGESEVAELTARIALHGFGDRKGLVECLVDVHGKLAERGLSAHAIALAVDPVRARSEVQAAFANVDAALTALKTAAQSSQATKLRVMMADAAKNALLAVWSSSTLDDPEAAVSRSFAEFREHLIGNWGGPKVANERKNAVLAVDALGAAIVDAFTASLAPAVKSLLIELDARQRTEKIARGFLGFGDLLLATRDLLQNDVDVRDRVRSRFARVLVDEYQDTSPVQEEVLALLCGDDDASSQTGRDLFLVGDPKQSIYGFRGADATVFTRALATGAREELAVSRRSLAPIVDVANLVAQHALPRGSFGVDVAQIVALSALRGGVGIAGEHWRVASKPDDAAENVDDDAPELPPHELESLVVAKQLRGKLDANEFRARDVAILVRRGKASVPLARALARVGIASVVVGGDGFYVRPEITDIIAALTLAADPADEIAVLTVLRSPLVALTDDEILALYEKLPNKRGLTWPLVVTHAQNASGDRARAFDAVLTTVKKRLHHPTFERTGLARAIDALLDDAGYAAACAVEHDAALRLRNLEKLRALVETMRESSLVALSRLASAIDDPPPEPLAQAAVDESDAVRIMTIHQAKGLEFPVVVLADAGSGLKGETDDIAFDPSPTSGLAVTARGRPIAACVQKSGRTGAPTAIQRVRRRLRERNECELARLLYVAVTRARDRLFVVGAPRRNGTGSLLGLLDHVRAQDTPRFDALLPRIEVDPFASVAAPSPSTTAQRSDIDFAALRTQSSAQPSAQPSTHPSAPSSTSRRVRASQLASALERQLGLGLATAQTVAVDDDDRLPPRPAGRLAHAVVALVATEAADALATPDALTRAIARAARACGVVDAPSSLLDRIAATLAGPVRALVDEGCALSFEEPLWLAAEGVVVEGKADLVARSQARTVVVELKLAEARAKGPAALLQVSAYAAALEQRGERAVHVATWALGDGAPAPAAAFGRTQRASLERALAALPHT